MPPTGAVVVMRAAADALSLCGPNENESDMIFRKDDDRTSDERRRIHRSFWLVGLLGLVVGGCVLFTDAATRLGHDVVENAASLRADSLSERTFTHVPRSWPGGCDADYAVTFQESLHHPATGGSLLVGCKGESNFHTLGYSYATTYHLNAVRVPHTLSVEKRGGSALDVTLRKQGAAIEVTALR